MARAVAFRPSQIAFIASTRNLRGKGKGAVRAPIFARKGGAKGGKKGGGKGGGS